MKKFKVFVSVFLVGCILLLGVSTFALGTSKTNLSVVLKTNTSIKYSDGFACAIANHGTNFYKDYVAVSFVTKLNKNYKVNNVKINGYNKNKEKTFPILNYEDYTSDLNYSDTIALKNLDFFETLKTGKLEGNVVFKVPNNDLSIISFDDGIHKFEFTLSSITDIDGNDVTFKESTNEDTSDDTNNHNDSDTIDSISDLQEYLEDNFSSLKTSLGTTHFTFTIDENSMSFFPYDYWVQVGFDLSFFNNLSDYNIKLTDDQKQKVRTELKDFQEKIAKAIISKMPNKKFYGGYYKSWYKYPNIKVDLISRRYFSWTNYDNPSIIDEKAYEKTKLSSFQWFNLIDNKF